MRSVERIIFLVEGDGQFPIDMLRYDRCWPLREGRDTIGVQAGGHRKIVLETQDARAPTTRRWQSFGWRVTTHEPTIRQILGGEP